MIPRQDGLGEYERNPWRSYLFRDRNDAGMQLGQALGHLRASRPLVLGIPRGGVPVAREVARALDAELDVVVTRKLGVPGQEELAMGAIAADGTVFINEELRALVGVSDDVVARAMDAQRKEASRRELRFRADQPPLNVAGRTVIIVDDGLATGATMRVAVRAIRHLKPKKLVVAVPVGSPTTCDSIGLEVDELVCSHRPEPLFSVGEHYEEFGQTSDEEVEAILRQHRQSHPPKPAHGAKRESRA
jgi:putative phosphoribosyl transferase